jgi:hypothetical protein
VNSPNLSRRCELFRDPFLISGIAGHKEQEQNRIADRAVDVSIRASSFPFSAKQIAAYLAGGLSDIGSPA